MPDPKMTAEERINERQSTIAPELLDRYDIRDLMEEHAAAAVKELEARVAELERERDSAAALANALLLDIGQIAEALGSEASEPAALLADAQALKARVAELERRLYESFQFLPVVPGDALAWVDYQLVPHVARVADEYAILQRQREAAEARIVELEAERDEARERAICAASSEARRIDERDIAYAALTSAAKALAANDFDLAREVLCRSSARDKAAELRRADMKHTLAAAARAEKAEARVAELEGILHDAPTIDAVESHVPGWLARVRAALGKEAQT